jgi:hypothetical protein
VQEAISTKCNTPLSEAFRIEILAIGFTLIVECNFFLFENCGENL